MGLHHLSLLQARCSDGIFSVFFFLYKTFLSGLVCMAGRQSFWIRIAAVVGGLVGRGMTKKK